MRGYVLIRFRFPESDPALCYAQDGRLAIHSLTEEKPMNTIARMAALLAPLLFASGCTRGMHHSDRPLRDPVRLPSAPALEPSSNTPGMPNMSGPTPSPLSSSAPQRPTGPN